MGRGYTIWWSHVPILVQIKRSLNHVATPHQTHDSGGQAIFWGFTCLNMISYNIFWPIELLFGMVKFISIWEDHFHWFSKNFFFVSALPLSWSFDSLVTTFKIRGLQALEKYYTQENIWNLFCDALVLRQWEIPHTFFCTIH